MATSKISIPNHPLALYIDRLMAGEALLEDTPRHLIEVVGILKSYGVVLDAYSKNLLYISENQFLVFFPFFKYFNGDVSIQKLLKHWWHDRINFEYAEYCMKTMFWHGGGGLDSYVDSLVFQAVADKVIQAKFRGNPFILILHRAFPEFLPEQLRMMAYYSGLGQFWRVMADAFLSLSDLYDKQKITSIADVVAHIKKYLVDNANQPITYAVKVKGKADELIPKSAGLTFLADTAIPYVEAIFFRGTPFPGTVSYNAQVYQIPYDQEMFTYGALYADPLPIGGAGIPPTLLMQDMRHFLPDYLHNIYKKNFRQEEDLLVQICESFQKSMFCVTTATIQGLAPYPLTSQDPEQQKVNRTYLKGWMNRLVKSQLVEVNR